MGEQLKFGDKVKSNVERSRAVKSGFDIHFKYKFELVRDGKIIDVREVENVVTSEGKQYLLDAGIGGETSYTQKTSWYVLLVSNDGPPPSPATSHNYDAFVDTTVVEFTEYTSGTRPAYVEVVSADKITNAASKASFTMSSPTKDVYGAALVSNSTKSHHTAGDYLMSWAALPGGVLDVQDTDVLNIEIELAFA